jgi:hypothetical protein
MTAQQVNPLLDTIDMLTIEHVVTSRLDTGDSHFERHDALIKQLRDAIASNLGGAAGGKAARERIPLDADALVKYEQIEREIGERYRERVQSVPGLFPEENLRAWYLAFDNAHRAGTVSDGLYDDELRTMLGWARLIEEKLSPPTIRELVDDDNQPELCPECGAGWFEVIMNRGVELTREDGSQKFWYDKERRVALTATYRPDGHGGLEASSAECGCCGTRWVGVRGVRMLAYELENPKTAETEQEGETDGEDGGQ